MSYAYTPLQTNVPTMTNNRNMSTNIQTEPVIRNKDNTKPVNIYVDDENNIDNTNIVINCKNTTGKYIYMVFHIIMAFVAIYLSWKCNNGKFNLLSFLIALFFPYIYIIYILATRGTCDRIEL
jgi:hypothetical protein